MFFLGLLFFLLAIGCAFRNNKFWTIIILAVFTILIAYRGPDTGTDTRSYIDMYRDIVSNGYTGYPEPLYGYAEVLFSKLGFDFYEFQLAMTTIMMTIIYLTVRKSSPNYAFSLFVFYGLYFVMYTMNVYRQMFAVTLVLYGYTFLYQNRKLIFAGIIIAATLIHFSSIIAFAALLVPKINIRSTTPAVFYVIMSIVIGSVISDHLLFSLAGKYAHYLTSISGTGLRSDSRFILALLLSLFLSGLLLMCYLSATPDQRNNFWFKLYFVGILLNNICLQMELGLRITWIFSISGIIALAIIVTQGKNKTKRGLSFAIGCCLCILFFTFLLTNSARILPYENKLLPGL